MISFVFVNERVQHLRVQRSTDSLYFATVSGSVWERNVLPNVLPQDRIAGDSSLHTVLCVSKTSFHQDCARAQQFARRMQLTSLTFESGIVGHCPTRIRGKTWTGAKIDTFRQVLPVCLRAGKV